MVVLMNDMRQSAAIDFGFISSKTRWFKLKLSRVKVCLMAMLKKGRSSGITWTGL